MPKRIVLIEPQHGTYEFEYVPQGLLNIAAILKNFGHDVSVHTSLPIPSCDILGISATISQYNQAISISRMADAGIIVLGGAFATTSPVEAISSPAINLVVVGDGESALLELANNSNPREIPGVVYIDKSGAVVINPNLDIKYTLRGDRQENPAYYLLHEVGECINVTRNREYSWNWRWRRKNRPKYWEDFDAEVGQLLDLGVKSVVVTDEHFGDWHDNIRSTITALDKFDSWSCRATTDVVLSRRLDQKLRGSKCNRIELDIYSASDRMLAELGTTTAEDHNLAYELLDYADLNVRIHATLGLPGETIDSMMETWHWLKGKEARLSTFVPMPGTAYYEYCHTYNRFGFDIIGTNRCDFIVDDSAPLHYLPWSSGTISMERFMAIRNQMVEELVMNHE